MPAALLAAASSLDGCAEIETSLEWDSSCSYYHCDFPLFDRNADPTVCFDLCHCNCHHY